MEERTRRDAFARALVQPDYRRVFEASAALALIIAPEPPFPILGSRTRC